MVTRMFTPTLVPLPLADLIYQLVTFVAAYHWVILAGVFHLTVLGLCAYLILLERKTASWVQDRIGPNRVGLDFGLPFLPKFHFWGLGQPLADGLKFLVKEDYGRKGVDKILFSIAPMMMITVVIISIAVIPWGGVRQVSKVVDVDAARLPNQVFLADAAGNQRMTTAAEEAVRFYLPYDAEFVGPVNADNFDLAGVMRGEQGGYVGTVPVNVTYRYHFQIASLNIGVLFVLASLSLAVYGVVIGGWASNNKYSFLGGLRATANMISYEIPLGMSVLVIVIMFGSFDLAQIVDRQATYWWVGGVLPIPAWNLFAQPLAFLLFLVCIHAEANRAPFDMAEAEQELVGGYHTEYSSMRFALFFLAEYAGMVTTSCVLVALFWGGWHAPYIEWLWSGWNVDAVGSNSVTTSLIVCVIRAGVLLSKAVLVLFVFMWVRWSLPRFRFDQLMQIAWKGLIPIMLTLLVSTTLVVYFFGGRTFYGLTGLQALGFLAMNGVALGAIVLGSYLLPAGLNQNVKVHIPHSRFDTTALPKGVKSRKMAASQNHVGGLASGAALNPSGAGALGSAGGGLTSYAPQRGDRA